MSTQSAMSSDRRFAPAAPAVGTKKTAIGGLSLTGVWLFVTSLLVVGSGFTSLRPDVMGPGAASLPDSRGAGVSAGVNGANRRVSDSRAGGALVFTSMYCFSVVNGANVAVGEIFKTVVLSGHDRDMALLVRRRGDFVAGALGLSIAVAMLAVNGLQTRRSSASRRCKGPTRIHIHCSPCPPS